MGRTDNIRRRLAKREAFGGLSIRPGFTPTLEASEAFRAYFAAAKLKVRHMDIRVVEECDPLRQALLEIYCIVALSPEHNSFESH